MFFINIYNININKIIYIKLTKYFFEFSQIPNLQSNLNFINNNLFK